MIKRLAGTIDMSFKISDAEKKIAKDAVKVFDLIVNKLQLASKHLDIMYDPFSKTSEVPTEELIKKRGVLNRFKQAIKKNYFEIRQLGVKAINLINYFSSDMNISNMMSSFDSSMGDVTDSVELLLKTLDEFESNDFVDNIIRYIDIINQESSELDQIIKDRIIKFLEDNVIVDSWSDDSELNEAIVERVPLVTQLLNERQQALDSLHPTNPPTDVPENIMNPMQAASVRNPSKLRML